jgi:hypothetical protein
MQRTLYSAQAGIEILAKNHRTLYRTWSCASDLLQDSVLCTGPSTRTGPVCTGPSTGIGLVHQRLALVEKEATNQNLTEATDRWRSGVHWTNLVHP